MRPDTIILPDRATCEALLKELRESYGLTLSRKPGGLNASPAEAVTPEVRQRIAPLRESLLRYLAAWPVEPIAICSDILGEMILLAGDSCPVRHFHAGYMVYRASELKFLGTLQTEALCRFHRERRGLLKMWTSYGWVPARPRFDQHRRRLAGFEFTLQDMLEQSRLPRDAAERQLSYLLGAGLMKDWIMGGDLHYRLVDPSRRWEDEDRLAASQSAAPASQQLPSISSTSSPTNAEENGF